MIELNETANVAPINPKVYVKTKVVIIEINIIKKVLNKFPFNLPVITSNDPLQDINAHGKMPTALINNKHVVFLKSCLKYLLNSSYKCNFWVKQ